MSDFKDKLEITPKLLERFWSKVEKKGDDDCWEWTACKGSGGYGKLCWQYKNYTSHRLSWMIHFDEIPDGLYVCHNCDNPPCVNPKHLWIGTCLDNRKDMLNKGRQYTPGCRQAIPFVHRDKIEELVKVGVTYQQISEILGVHSETVRGFAKRYGFHTPRKSGYKARLQISEKAKIQELLESGETYPKIGALFGVSDQTIMYFAKKYGFYKRRRKA